MKSGPFQDTILVLAMSRANFTGYGKILIHIHCTRPAKGKSGGGGDMETNG
jgi:hypothetical protein